MKWEADHRIGWKIAFAFSFIILLGLAGYWNVDRAMSAGLRHNRQTAAVVNACVSDTQDAALNAHDTAANTLAFVYSGNDSDREHKWETNDAAKQAFSDLHQSLGELPNNDALFVLADAAAKQEESVCNPLEDRAIRLADNRQEGAAQALLNGPYVAARYKLELSLNSLIDHLKKYQSDAETAQAHAARRAVVVGWTVQGLILAISLVVAAAVSRNTSAALTQIRSAQARIQQSERQLLDAQRIAHLGNWRLDVATGSTAWSDEIYRILGLRVEEIHASHKTFLARIHPDDRRLVWETISAAQESRQPFSFYHRLRLQNGVIRWVHLRGEFLYPEAGGPTVMTGTLQDITDRRLADEALRESEARFERIVANLPSMVYRFVLHADGSPGFPFVSEGCRDIYEMAPEEFRRDPEQIMAMVHPEDQAVFRASISASAAALTPWSWEGRLCLLSGEERWVQGDARPSREDNGDVFWDGVLTDVTERKRTERTLSRSEERFRALISNASDTILILDAEARMRYFSPGMERQTGLAPSGLQNACLFDFVHPDDLPRVRAVFAQTEAKPSVNMTVEIRLRHADGTYRPVEVVAKNLFHEPGIDGMTVTCRDITERKAFEESLAHQAFHDALTGLPNRTLLMDRLERALVRSKRQGNYLSVLFLDLDNFKVINDSLGHEAGDHFLIEVTSRLQTCLRTGDTVARIGGDEFVLLLEDIETREEALQVAERISAALQSAIRLPTREVFTTASIGIAHSDADTTDPHGLLRDADTAMYRAKNRGKARHEVFTHSMNTQAMERLEMEGDLRRAIEQGELCLHYQPIVSLETGRLGEVEALVRWQHPERGLIPPAKFIPVAEETGLIVPLGSWVLREACRQTHLWQTLHPCDPPLVVSVNLSGRQLQESDCVAQIRHVLEEEGVLPSTLKLEITETVMMHDAEATAETLQQLRTLGVRLAVDDFGTGYSSMAYLSRFPIDTLKIDRAFIQQMSEPEGYAIVHAIITLAKSLNLHVTSEGIETQQQRVQLEELNCEWGQGYLFARPQTSDAFTALLASGDMIYRKPELQTDRAISVRRAC